MHFMDHMLHKLEHLSFFLIYIIIYNLIKKNQIYKVFT